MENIISVRISAGVPSAYWYSGLVGTSFDVKSVRSRVSGFNHSLTLFEIVGGDFDGEYLLPADCEIIAAAAA